LIDLISGPHVRVGLSDYLVNLVALPLVLAGPVLRRVQQNSVSVWIALSKPAKVSLVVYQGAVTATDLPGDSQIRGQVLDVDTLPVGKNLHVLVITARVRKLAPGAPEQPMLLMPGTLYSYDLTITTNGEPARTLLDLGFLAAPVVATKTTHARVPLGYAELALPGFSLPPQNLENLQLLHGSCRKPHGPGQDALSYADKLIADFRLDPDKRPHLLFLTGDQIYADDVADSLLPSLTALAEELLEDTPESLPIPPGSSVSRLLVDQAHLPAGLRQTFVETCAAFTSSSAASHLLSFGEYAAHYLFSWNNEVWPTDIETLPLLDEQLALLKEKLAQPAPPAAALLESATVLFGKLGKDVTQEQRTRFLQHLFSLGVAADGSSSKLLSVIDRIDSSWLAPRNINAKRAKFSTDQDLNSTFDFAKALSEADAKSFLRFFTALQEVLDKKHRSTAKQRDALADFYHTLPEVRRLLANVPTLMIWDDHDVTDDWNLAGQWVANMKASACGTDIVRNGMTAYALFQDWGNRPDDYAPGQPKAVLTEEIPKLFAPGNGPWPIQAAATALTQEFDRQGDAALPWHYAFEGVDFKGLVLNTRTERGYDSPLSAPNLIPLIADAGPLGRQVPTSPLVGRGQVLIVISPVPALGLPVMEQIGQTVAVAAIDFIEVAKGGKRTGATSVDVEAWALHREGFEDLLLRLAPNKRVIFLSGDVHYGAAAKLDHWRKDDAIATHFVQFTSSPSKNAWPAIAIHAFESFGFAQRMLQLHKTVERIGWLRREPQPIAVLQGAEPPLALLLLTEQEPVLLPNYPHHEDWQALSSTRPPDLRWRQTLLRDDRPDQDRAAAVQPLPLPGGDLSAADPLRAYREVLSRHADFVHKHAFTRSTLWTNNLGRIRFENRATQEFEAVQELFAAAPPGTEGEPVQIMAEFRAPLSPNFPDAPPELPGDL
jgi:hypothetical protein